MAARGGHAGEVYVWGDQFRPNGKWMANSYQGHFPNHDSGTDGFVGLAPVAQYPPNQYGLYDMAGNVWQWTSDWYRSDYHSRLAQTGGVARNPKGPDTAFDRAEPSEKNSSSRRIVSVHRPVLLTIHGGNARKGGGQHRYESSGISLRDHNVSSLKDSVKKPGGYVSL
jgi:formylglycine-generating enzyme required for sulfatase activity